MEKLQIPQGEYSVKPATETDCAQIVINHKMMVMIMPLDTINDEIESNMATVCSDALNTYQKHETLPSELLRQNQEMMEAIKTALSYFESCRDHWEEGESILYHDLYNTLNKDKE